LHRHEQARTHKKQACTDTEQARTDKKQAGEANVRTLLLVVAILGGVLPFVANPPIVAEGQAQAQGAGANPVGPLGPVNALGQEVKRPPAPTGPPPRLPDGTIDLGDGTWVNNPFTAASGLKPGEELPLLPAAKALFAARKPTEDPNAWCLPMGVMRYNPYPFRFIQNYTHKKPTHLYIMYELMRLVPSR
jgi:hypothetical protein